MSDDVEIELGTPSRSVRRAAANNGHILPIIQVMQFPDGTVKIDHHKDITNEQIVAFLETMVKKLNG